MEKLILEVKKLKTTKEETDNGTKRVFQMFLANDDDDKPVKLVVTQSEPFEHSRGDKLEFIIVKQQRQVTDFTESINQSEMPVQQYTEEDIVPLGGLFE